MNHQTPPQTDIAPFVNAVGQLESSMARRIADMGNELNRKLDNLKDDFHQQSIERAATMAHFAQATKDIAELKSKVATLDEFRTKWKTVFWTMHGAWAILLGFWLATKEFFKAKGP